MTFGQRSLLLTLAALAIFVVGSYEVGTAAQPRASVSIMSGSVKLSDLLPGVMTMQVILERKARSVTKEEVLPLLRSALISAGASQSSEIALSGFTTLLIPAEVTNQPDIESLDYDRVTGRFTAELLFDNSGADPLRLRINGVAQEMIDVPVLVHAMNAGSIISPEDLEVRRLPKGLVGDRMISAAQDAAGLALRHRMAAGVPISTDELTRPLMVTRGMLVLLRLQNSGLMLTAQGQAIDGGALDERVHVLNPGSRAVLVARVTGPGQVQVDPASTPVLLSSQQSGLPPAYSLATTTQSSNAQEPAR